MKSPASRIRSLLRASLWTVLLSALLVGLQVLPAQAAAGDLDPTFGNGGKVTTNPNGMKGWGNQLAIQSDGRILLTGFAGRAPAQDFALVRYNVNGRLDTTFGPNHTGIVTYDNAGKKDEARAIAVQPDGKILIGGFSASDYALLRYNSDGTLDSTFGTGGIVITNVFGEDGIRAILLQPDAKIVVAGFSGQNLAHDFSLARYNPSGTLDATFGTGGTVRTDFGADEQSRGAVLQSDGKIVVGGYSKTGTGGSAFYQFALARYNANGVLDTTFGTAGTGKVLTSLNPQASVIRAILLQPDGNYLVCGYLGGGGGLAPKAVVPTDPDLEDQGISNFVAARYLTNGTLDPSFGTSGPGYSETDLGGFDHGRGCALQPDGKIVLGGNTSDPTDTNENFGIVRYNPDGTLDSTFGSGGIVTPTDFGGSKDGARDVKIDASGRILAAGIAGPVANGGFNMALARYVGGLPTIDTIDPTSGPVSGGQCVTITGSYFQPGATVKFGAKVGTVEVPVQPTQMIAQTPAGAGTIDVTVTNPDGSSITDPGAYTYSGSLTAPSPAVGVSPGAAGVAAPELDAFDKTAAGTLQDTEWTCPPGWGNTENLGGSIASGPAASNMNAPQLQVFAQGTGNDLMEITRGSNGVWGAWTSLGGVLSAKPAAVSWGPGRIDVFVRGTDAHIWHKSYSSGVWSGWSNLGGVVAAGAGPAAASMGVNLLEVFAAGTNKAIWEKTWNGSTWSGWSSLGGVVVGDPGAVSPAASQVQVFARGTDNTLSYKSYASGVWGSWKSLGGTLTSGPAPAVATAGANPMVTAVYALWTDNALWEIRSTSGVWGVWTKVP